MDSMTDNLPDISGNEGKAQLIKKHSPKTKVLKNCTLAFLGGGALCLAAEGLLWLYTQLGADEKTALTLVSISMVLVGALATAFGFFDKVARHVGAGTLVPITGFSNAVVSQAIDSKSEGVILGVGSKIFTVAGPVILFGLSSGIIYGLIYYIVTEVSKMI